jgi:hypothetical protein
MNVINSRMERKTTKLLSCYLVVAVLAIGFVQNVYAGFVPSEVMNLTGVDQVEDLQKIQSTLELKMVSERLKQLGFTTEDIKAKLAYLSDEQLHNIAVQVDGLRVGGEFLTVVLAAVFVACIAWSLLVGVGILELR